jgi:phosphotriesterase-related protein
MKLQGSKATEGQGARVKISSAPLLPRSLLYLKEKQMPKLITTLGHYEADQLGLILPHEHIFVDLGPIEEKNYLKAKAEDVISLMAPEIEKIKALGVTALVECTPASVGRRADIDRAVSEATNFPVLVPTGIYHEPWVPDWAHEASQEEIRDWMLKELTEEIEESGVQAAWIKLSASDDGMTPSEKKILRAAAQAGAETGAVIGSHTVRGRVVMDQLDVLEAAGYSVARFIWIHTQNEPDLSLHMEAVRRGAWIEYDGIGRAPHDDNYYLARIREALDAGFGEQILLSHDVGWYDPSKPGGGVPRPYTHLSEVFIPKMRESGFDERTIRQLTCLNPFRAFAR